MEKGFIGTIANLTLEHIIDCDFCQTSSYLLYVTAESLESVSQITEFFFEIKELDVISALMTNYYSNDKIAFNTLNILIKVIINSRHIEKVGGTLKTFFESGLFETIGLAMKESKDDSFIKLCECMFSFIISSGKRYKNTYEHHYFRFHIHCLGLDEMKGHPISEYYRSLILENPYLRDELDLSKTGSCKRSLLSHQNYLLVNVHFFRFKYSYPETFTRKIKSHQRTNNK